MTQPDRLRCEGHAPAISSRSFKTSPVVHILLVLIAFGIVLILVLRRLRRPERQAVNLNELDLRSAKDAIHGFETHNTQYVLHWAIAHLDGPPHLDIKKIARFIEKKWRPERVDANVGSAPFQRTVTFGESRIAFEPVSISADFYQTYQGSKPKPGSIAVLTTALSSIGGAAGALVLSQAVLALVNTCRQVSDAYWMSSEQTLARDDLLRRLGVDFREFSQWPVNVWVATNAFKNDRGSTTGYTIGLGTMGGTDFEALDSPETPGELESRLAWLAHYVVAQFGLIYNGDTTGIDGFERIRLKKRPSETVHKGWVFQLHYERPSRDSGWKH